MIQDVLKHNHTSPLLPVFLAGYSEKSTGRPLENSSREGVRPKEYKEHGRRSGNKAARGARLLGEG